MGDRSSNVIAWLAAVLCWSWSPTPTVAQDAAKPAETPALTEEGRKAAEPLVARAAELAKAGGLDNFQQALSLLDAAAVLYPDERVLSLRDGLRARVKTMKSGLQPSGAALDEGGRRANYAAVTATVDAKVAELGDQATRGIPAADGTSKRIGDLLKEVRGFFVFPADSPLPTLSKVDEQTLDTVWESVVSNSAAADEEGRKKRRRAAEEYLTVSVTRLRKCPELADVWAARAQAALLTNDTASAWQAGRVLALLDAETKNPSERVVKALVALERVKLSAWVPEGASAVEFSASWWLERAGAATAALPDARQRDRLTVDVAQGLARSGDAEGALRAAEAVADIGKQIEARAWAGAALAKAGNAQRAAATLDAVREAIPRLSDKTSKTSAQQQAIWALTFAKEYERALQIANSMAADSYQESSLGVIASSQAYNGQVDAAFRTVEAMKGDKSYPLSAIVFAQAKKGEIEQARRTAQRIAAANFKDSALSSIACAQAKAGDLDGARRTMESMSAQKSRSFPLCEIAKSLSKNGDAEGARASFAESVRTVTDEKGFMKSLQLLSIAEKQMECGDTEGARKTLELAREAAESESFVPSRVSLLVSTGIKQKELGDLAAATATLDTARRAATGASGYERSAAIGQLANSLAEGGNMREAWETLSELKSSSEGVGTMCRIAQFLSRPKSDRK